MLGYGKLLTGVESIFGVWVTGRRTAPIYTILAFFSYSTRRLYSKHFSTMAPSATSGVYSNPSLRRIATIQDTYTGRKTSTKPFRQEHIRHGVDLRPSYPGLTYVLLYGLWSD